MTSTDLEGYSVTAIAVPASRANGLWTALAARVSESSAGSRLVDPTGVDQPVSALLGRVIDMFSYDTGRCDDFDPLPAA